MALLDSIDSPDDLKKLQPAELKALADEIRERIIEVVGRNGGHLSSNLGVVDLTLAIHRVFDSPYDAVVWDVGHQSYAHKLLTGRRREFDRIRQSGGISGFPKRSESEHDAFDTGHASTSISAALDNAAGRGVRVQIVMCDNAPSPAQATAVTDLKAHGVHLVKVVTPYIHAKSIVVDGKVAYVGSENFTASSLIYNRELGVLVSAAAEVAKVLTTTRADFARGTAL